MLTRRIQWDDRTAFRATNPNFFKLLKPKNKFHIDATGIEDQSRDALRCCLAQRLEAGLGQAHAKRVSDIFHSFWA